VLATRSLRVQAQIIAAFPRNQLRWMRWHMTQAVLDRFRNMPIKVAGLTAFTDPPTGPELFGIPVRVIEQPDGEAAPWGLYLGVAA
jgi:hypothetical protein